MRKLTKTSKKSNFVQPFSHLRVQFNHLTSHLGNPHRRCENGWKFSSQSSRTCLVSKSLWINLCKFDFRNWWFRDAGQIPEIRQRRNACEIDFEECFIQVSHLHRTGKILTPKNGRKKPTKKWKYAFRSPFLFLQCEEKKMFFSWYGVHACEKGTTSKKNERYGIAEITFPLLLVVVYKALQFLEKNPSPGAHKK